MNRSPNIRIILIVLSFCRVNGIQCAMKRGTWVAGVGIEKISYKQNIYYSCVYDENNREFRFYDMIVRWKCMFFLCVLVLILWYLNFNLHILISIFILFVSLIRESSMSHYTVSREIFISQIENIHEMRCRWNRSWNTDKENE